jgi:DNA (cytosine-5)-methyltransferase 1
MSEGKLPYAPIWDNVSTLRGEQLPTIDIIYGGFPCQDISCAGNRVGLGGERSGLFYHIARLIKETNPKFVFLENVPAIRTRGLNGVAQTLTDIGYDCRWTIVSAKEVGACHLRKRWFMLAHANSEHKNLRQTTEREPDIQSYWNGVKGSIANSDGKRLEGHEWGESKLAKPCGYGEQLSESSLCRGAHGLLGRVDRLKGLGNAVVPAQVEKAFMKLLGQAKEIVGEL